MEHLDILVKLATLIIGFGAIAKWIVHRIEQGQKSVIAEHRRDFKAMKKQLKKCISKEQCKHLRAQCPCRKGAIK